MKTYRSKRTMVERPRITSCFFCDSDKDPDYKDYETIGKYMSDRAKIWGRARTGLCAKHQRRLAQAAKRARHLGLLPFTSRV